MTGSQKALKVISIIVIILAVLCVLAGAALLIPNLAYVSADFPNVEGADRATVAAGAALMLVISGVLIVSGVIDLIVGILGLRGAKDPKKIGGFFAIAVIGLIIATINLAITLFSGQQLDFSTLSAPIAQLVVMLICVILANNVRNLRNRIYDQGFRQQQR